MPSGLALVKDSTSRPALRLLLHEFADVDLIVPGRVPFP
jgi:hypothetical protein